MNVASIAKVNETKLYYELQGEGNHLVLVYAEEFNQVVLGFLND